jgi:hypothetical protein
MSETMGSAPASFGGRVMAPKKAPDQDSDRVPDVADAQREELAMNEAAPGAPMAPVAPAPPPPPSATAASGSARAPEAEVARGPILIYTAEITMAVYEVDQSLAKVEALARDLGGFLAKREDRSVTIRVPAARFDGAVDAIAGFGDVLHRNVTAEDVTEQYRDIAIRLRNARAVRDRLEALLGKAQKIEESIALERELARVTNEIEQMEGRLKYLRDRATYSTITVRFQPRAGESVSRSTFHLPVPWLQDLGLGRLLNL